MLRLPSLKMSKFWITILVWLNWINFTPPLQAKPWSWELSQHDSLDFSGDGRPKRTAGGASRGECQVQQPSEYLTALIPNTSVALTVAAAPTFWFYVPYNLLNKHSVELVLKDKQGEFLYQHKFSGKEVSSGIVSFSLPSTIELSTKENYAWYFVIYCDRHNPEKFVYVNGSIRRIENSVLKNKLTEVDREEKLILYTQAKIWYDTLTILAESLRTEPQNPQLQADWLNLLQSIGLEHLANKSFQTCCLSESVPLVSNK